MSSCRFGLAFGKSGDENHYHPFDDHDHLMLRTGTSGKGLIALGKLAKNLIKGELVILPRSRTVQSSSYTVFGDVTINNTIVAENQTIIMDVGTDNIQGHVIRIDIIRVNTNEAQPNRHYQIDSRHAWVPDPFGSGKDEPLRRPDQQSPHWLFPVRSAAYTRL